MKRNQIIIIVIFSIVVSFMLILVNDIEDIVLGIITFLIVLNLAIITYK